MSGDLHERQYVLSFKPTINVIALRTSVEQFEYNVAEKAFCHVIYIFSKNWILAECPILAYIKLSTYGIVHEECLIK